MNDAKKREEDQLLKKKREELMKRKANNRTLELAKKHKNREKYGKGIR